MSSKIFRGIFGVAALLTMVTLYFVMDILGAYFNREITRQIQTEEKLIERNMDFTIHDSEKLKEAMEKTFGMPDSSSEDQRVTLVSPEGTVLYDNKVSAESMENHRNREEIREAFASGEGESRRYSSSLYKQTIYYARKLPDGNVLRIAADRSGPLVLFLTLLQPILSVLVIGIILAAVISHLIARKIVKPINEIDPEHPGLEAPYEEIRPLVRKLTDQKETIRQQMNQLKQKQEEFSVITENMSEGLIVIGRNAEVLSLNQAVRKMFDVKMDPENIYGLNRSTEFVEVVQSSLSGRRKEEELEKDERIYLLIGSPVSREDPEENGEAAGAVMILIDVTEERRQEKLRKEFTANVSHELKTPLTSIYGVADMLRGGLVQAEDVPKFAEDITRESQRMIRLINDIIRLSQLDSANLIDTEKTKVDLYILAEHVAAQLKDEAARRNIQINVSGSRHQAVVYGVGTMIEEVIYNLTDNAIKYNRDGGMVDLVTVSDQNWVKLMVKDTGIGIAPEHQSRIFERFYRVDKSHSRQIGGTGLGLSIVKHIVGLHHGRIQVESKVGEGTRMIISFPVWTN